MSTFIFDLDGTIYLEDDLIPGARDTLAALRAEGHHVLFASNNTTLTHATYERKLAALDIAIEPHGLATAPRSTVAYLRTLSPVRTLLVLGPPALSEELEEAGFTVRHDTARPIDAVVVGHDDAFSYERLRLAHAAVVARARLIATDGDRHVPRRAGLFPGTVEYHGGHRDRLRPLRDRCWEARGGDDPHADGRRRRGGRDDRRGR